MANYLDLTTGLPALWAKIKNLINTAINNTLYAGSSTVGGAALKSAGILYGQVDSTSTATAFTATVDGLSSLYDGACVYLRNGVVTSASGFTLNINNLGAKHVYSNMAAATAETTVFNINYTMLFVYNSTRVSGGCWDLYRGYNSDNNTLAYQVRDNQSSNVVKSALYRYQICFSSFDGDLIPTNSVNNSTGTTKTLTTNSFNPFGPIYYYSTTTNISANNSPGAAYLWTQYHAIDLRYSFNAGSTLTTKKPVYIKCSPQSDGSFKLAGNACIVQDLPSTDDEYVYLYLGRAYSDHQISMAIQHPAYYYEDGAIRLWTCPIVNGDNIAYGN